MADFLTDEERAGISGDMDMVFDTMSKGRTITVIKEPIRTLVSLAPSSDNLFGFGDNQATPVYEYTPVSGVFPVVVMYPKVQEVPLNAETNVRVYVGLVSIKVKRDCKDFMSDGDAIQDIIMDDQHFNLDGGFNRQMTLHTEYFLVNMKSTT